MPTIPPPPLVLPLQRPTYHEGMLLEAEDFLNQSQYHRGQVAQVIARLHGHGTVAGLRAQLDDADNPTEIRVRPGVAVDTAGRLLELAATQCLRLQNWFDYVVNDEQIAPTLVPRNVAGERTLIADICIGYREFQQGLRPAFPEAAVDATDAVVAHRLVESVHVSIHPIPSPGGVDEPPEPAFPEAIADRAALLDRVFASYPSDIAAENPAPAPGAVWQPPFTGAVFLARLRLPLTDAGALQRSNDAARKVELVNAARPILPAVSLLFAASNLSRP
jgi:hypothetical protein